MNRRNLTIFSVVVVGALALLSGWAWLQLPADAEIPIHWGLDGQVDGYASKAVGLLLIPLVTAGVAALFWVIPIVEPRRANIEKSGKAYGAIWLSATLLLAAIGVLVVAAALGSEIDTTLIVFVGVGALFIVIGNYLPKVRSNYMVGIRTPWTLTSELSWDRTHRVGGRLFVLEGIAFIVLGLLRPGQGVFTAVLIGGIAIMLTFIFAYSYRVWKMDPNRREA